MAFQSIAQVAQLAGVSIRTLHHYDAIGLLRPSRSGEGAYRAYDRDDLLRLQHILTYRALGFSLGAIAAVLDAPGADRLVLLSDQRERLAREVGRLQAMLTTLDRTIETLQGHRTMNDTDLYRGFVDPEKQAGYEAWLTERFGRGVQGAIAQSKAAMAQDGAPGLATRMNSLSMIEADLANALRQGVPPQARALDPLIERHREWVAAMWGRACSAEAYAGLADLYLAHPDFVARYETIAPGFAGYLSAAMKAWARRQEAPVSAIACA